MQHRWNVHGSAAQLTEHGQLVSAVVVRSAGPLSPRRPIVRRRWSLARPESWSGSFAATSRSAEGATDRASRRRDAAVSRASSHRPGSRIRRVGPASGEPSRRRSGSRGRTPSRTGSISGALTDARRRWLRAESSTGQTGSARKAVGYGSDRPRESSLVYERFRSKRRCLLARQPAASPAAMERLRGSTIPSRRPIRSHALPDDSDEFIRVDRRRVRSFRRISPPETSFRFGSRCCGRRLPSSPISARSR